MSARLRVFIAVVLAAAVALLATHLPGEWRAHGVDYALWVLVCVASELMVVPVVSGEGITSAASSANLATAMLWGQIPAMWVCGLSTIVGERLLFHEKPWVRVLFNGAQNLITLWAAAWVFGALGGPRNGLESAGLPLDLSRALHLALPVVGLVVTYELVSRALVAVAVAWSTEVSYWRVLRNDWFYPEKLISDGAYFLLAPILVVAFQSIRYAGVLLFFAPLYMIYLSSRRYIELRRTQDQMVQRERMAAMGQMASGIGHNMRQQLTAISGRAQMILKATETASFEEVPRWARIIIDQSNTLKRVADSLMDFAQTKLKIERVDVGYMISMAIELARMQKECNGVEWDIQLDNTVPHLRADPVQLQQVVLNLLINAADAMQDKPLGRKRLEVRCTWDESSQRVVIRISDTGVGIAPEVLPRIFDPQFTTKSSGHGFGLSTSYTIVENHGGKITAESTPGEGATFTVTLPLEGPGSWS